MRILFISESYYPYQSGVPIVVKYLAEGLAEKHQVSVATSISKNDCLPIVDELNGVKIYRFVIYRDLTKKLRGDIKGLQRFVINCDYDIIIIECGQAATTDAWLPIMGQTSPPCVLHAHGLSGLLCKPFVLKSDFKHTIGATYNWLRMQFYYGCTFKRQCKHFAASISLTNCDSGYNYLSKHINNNYVLCNAADEMFFEESNMNYDLPIDGKPYLVSIANYSVVKNQIEMLREFYLSDKKNIALVIIGSQKNAYYQDLIKKKEILDILYGKHTVVLLTDVDRKYFPNILSHASGYLVSSTYEEFSISIIEAMSRGIPFISTNVGNAHQLPGGIVVDDVRQMHIAIDTLLADKERCEQLGKDGKKYAYENCRLKTAIDKMERILEDVVSNIN